MRTCRRLRVLSIHASLYHLGEYLTDGAAIENNVRHALDAISALGREGMHVHISVDPTQIGHQVSRSLVVRHALQLGLAIRETATATGELTDMLMLDMEDPGLVDDTMELYRCVEAQGLPVGITVQACLHRSVDDVEQLIRRGGRIRLVKGAFAPPTTIAFETTDAIRAAFIGLAERLLSGDARSAACYPSFATHDEVLIDRVRQLATSRQWKTDEFEFEMLLGVRPDLQVRLARGGYRVRAYVPFGTDWWPYAARRIGEYPPNLLLALRPADRRARYQAIL